MIIPKKVLKFWWRHVDIDLLSFHIWWNKLIFQKLFFVVLFFFMLAFKFDNICTDSVMKSNVSGLCEKNNLSGFDFIEEFIDLVQLKWSLLWTQHDSA